MIPLRVQSASTQKDRQSQTGLSGNTKPNIDRKVSEHQQHTGQGEAGWLREHCRAENSPGLYTGRLVRGTSLIESSQGAAGGGERTQRNS